MIFENLSNLFADNTAVINDKGERINYKKLDDFSKYLGYKIPKRSLVFSLSKNTLGSFVGYYSFLKNKVVPLMLEAKIDLELLGKLISIYNPEFIWLPIENISMFSNKEVIYSVFDYILIKRKTYSRFQFNDELALLLTTSGSTGSPKLVMLSYENIKSNALSINEYLSINQNERPITTLPMSYSFGLSIINTHLYSGATILLTNRTFFEKEFWIFLKEQKATSLSGVPYTFEILKKLRFFKMNIPSIKTITQAGGKMNVDLNKEYVEFCHGNNKRFFVMYGQTEATARMSYLPHEQSLSKLGSIGIAIPDGEFSLIDDSGYTISENNVVGELVYRGKNVSLGYAECGKDLSKNDVNKGILVTGDIAKRDDEGFYFIVGRKKRFLKIFGNRVNLDETEQLLKSIVSDCACIGDDDKMIVYITDKTLVNKTRNFISLKTNIHQSAFLIRFIDAIPKNSSGKTLYSSLTL
jgi:acyl-CoA synthetase (AMP-forming)/AMP-acid ligase II